MKQEKKPIGIIAALDFEAQGLIDRMENVKKESFGGLVFYAGCLMGHPAVISVCGVGKVNAALCAQTMILRYSPYLILKTGVAGTLTEKAGIGDLVVAENVVQHDYDTTPLGDPPGYQYKNGTPYFPCDIRSREILSLARESGMNAVYGTVASGDQFVADEKEKKRIVETFHAVSCEMEAGAVAQSCDLCSVPLVIVLSISDEADGSGPSDFLTFARESARHHIDLILRYLSQ